MKRIAILGSTGSIGQSALAVVAAHPDRLRVVALAAGENVVALRRAGRAVRTRHDRDGLASGLADVQRGSRHAAVPTATATACGAEGLIAVATHPDADVVLFASSGTAALDAVLAAIDSRQDDRARQQGNPRHGGLASSWSAARRRGVAVLPVDSEHNAIHQCLHGRAARDIRRLILTASGGPFRDLPAARLASVTPDDALRHPTWRMGPKITIDSATLMNKGLEVIEAHWLFDVPAEQIDVVVHPQSIVHSMVELVDGSIIAQLGVTDMRLPIQYAFSYPDRWAAPLPPLDLTRAGRLDFEPPDTDAFPVPGPGVPGARGDARAADRAERGERSRRGGVSGHRLGLQRFQTSSRSRWRPTNATARPRFPAWTTCGRSIDGRGSSPSGRLAGVQSKCS